MSQPTYISYEEATKLVYVDKIIRMDELLIHLHKENELKVDVVKKFNPELVKQDGTIDLKIGEERNGKMKMVCIGHETKKDNSTGILLSTNQIKCFTGGCVFSKGLNVVKTYLLYKLGIDSELVLNDKAYEKLGKEKYRAIAELVEMKGYKIKHTIQKKRMSREDKQKKVTQDILNLSADLYHKEFLANEEAKRYFLEAEIEETNEEGEVQLDENNNPKMIKARGFKYVKGEEYALEQAKRFKIGFAPKRYPSNWLYEKLSTEYTTEELLRASVVKWHEYKDDSDKVTFTKASDFHSYGLILPYWHMRHVINLYSRAITAAKDWRHLRNAGGNDVPINFEEAIKYKVVNVVEGELTWFTKILFGYENTLGNRGTNGMLREHIDLLIKAREDSGGVYCQTIVLCFDGDGPGLEATLKTGQMLIEAGFNVLVVLMPAGMDHNDLLLKYKEDAKRIYDELYNNPVSFYTFVALSKIKEGFNSGPEQLQKLAEVKQVITENNIVNEVELSIIANEFSNKSNIPVDTILKEWNKENKNTNAFYEETDYAFVTKDIEKYFLIKFAFRNKSTYVEDTNFNFIQNEPQVKNILVDKDSYTEEEIEEIEQFGARWDIRIIPVTDFSDIIQINVNEQVLINQIFANV